MAKLNNDKDRIAFIKANFSAAYREQMEDNRVLGYDKTNNFIIRDWQQLIRDAIDALDYAYDKIHNLY